MSVDKTIGSEKSQDEPVKASSISKNSLTEGPIGERLIKMAIPMMVGIFATMSLNLVDTFFVSSLGEIPLAALSFTFPVVMLLVSLSIGLGAGTSSVVSYAVGKQDEKGVKALTTDGMTLTALASILLGVIGLLTLDPLFIALGAEPEILPHIRDYMVIWYIGVSFFTVPMVGMSAMRALGTTKFQGHMMTLTAVANAVLDPFLIFGIGPFPRLEIEGAALATLIVRVVSVIVLLYWLRVKMDLLVNPFDFSRFVHSSKKILHVGIPAMATNMIIPVSGAIVIALVAQHGTEAVAGFGVATRIEAMALIMFYALSSVVGPFCGQNLGAKKYDRLQEGQLFTLKFCVATGLSLAVFLALLGEWLAGFFSDDAEVIRVTVYYLYIVPISYFAYGIVMSVNASFNGFRKPFPGVVISSARVIFVLLPVAWVANYLYGVTGLMVAIALSNLLVGVIAYIWVQRTVKAFAAQA